MPSIFRNLVTRPALLYHGNAFYPYGNSLTFAETLLTPSLIGGPLDDVTGIRSSPTISRWRSSGRSRAGRCTRCLLGHQAIPPLAGGARFTLCPMSAEYYVEFQIQTLFGIPLTVYALVRFFEEQRPRHLAAALVAYWAQAVAGQYYRVILGFGLAMVGSSAGAPRAPAAPADVRDGSGGLRGARPRPRPDPPPDVLTRREAAFERSAGDAAMRSADAFTYLEARRNLLYHAASAGFTTETTLFLGFGALALALVARPGLRRPAEPRSRIERALGGAVWGCVGLGVLLGLLLRPSVPGALAGVAWPAPAPRASSSSSRATRSRAGGGASTRGR